MTLAQLLKSGKKTPFQSLPALLSLINLAHFLPPSPIFFTVLGVRCLIPHFRRTYDHPASLEGTPPYLIENVAWLIGRGEGGGE